MSNVYLIGGAPRSGKATAMKILVDKKPMFAASTDAIRYTLRRVLSKDRFPELFEASKNGFDSPENIAMMKNEPEKMVAIQNAESELVWQSCINFIASNLEDGQDVVVEGVAVLPKNIQDLPFKPKALFTVNLTDQTEVIKQHARNNPNDWLHGYSDELIGAFGVFNQKQNEYFHIEAQKYDLSVAMIDNDNFLESVTSAVDQLLGKSLDEI